MKRNQTSFEDRFCAIHFPNTEEVAAVVVDSAFPDSFPSNIINYSRQNRHFFEPSVILDGKVTDQRRSSTCTEIEELKEHLQQTISAQFVGICGALQTVPFQLLRIEAQLTYHQNGDFFRAHRDNRGLITRSRIISYVYYFRTENAQFEGGQLRVHKTSSAIAEAPEYDAPFVDVEPKHNRIVFFLSDNLHEVMEIKSSADDFINGRGSIVGWLRTADVAQVKLLPGETPKHIEKVA